MNRILFAATVIFTTLIACNETENGNGDANNMSVTEAIPAIQYAVVNKYPHDTSYFTEGLEFYKGQLFESSGGNADESPYPSELGISDLKTGKVTTKVQLDKTKYFGEGITFFNDKLYQLTWTSQIGFVYDANTFKKIKEFKLPSKEGWGLTHDSTHLIMSDGTSNLYYLTPDSLKLQNILRVTDNNGPVANMNELEYINGYIYANQWETSYILKIDPATGKVVGRINLENLQKEASSLRPGADVLNGIAYNPETGQVLVTGKRWPFIYEIKIQ
ncbi:glutaminyl-peptide cyclotransferase [Longitalea luteola]|uniref:glutaminyl-peptide cyclotransferase n=1 Tax=Longitalea luteola TaxID=2812563 RepID=UPI001A95AB4D|nr:glutaminyl-peptide cyclotransferase [Longitalea luteola]